MQSSSSSSSSAGLGVASLTPEQRVQLEELVEVVRWEDEDDDPGDMEGRLQCLLEEKE